MIRSLGPYSLLEEIGEGGLSKIYLAVKNGRPYAVKCLKERDSKDGQITSDFIREIRILAALDHPNIPKIFDEGKSDETHFVAMELLLGVTVQELIDSWKISTTPVPLPFTLFVIRECCRILSYLHKTTAFENSRSVLFHGDVSPDNLMITQEGAIKLMDFGSAGQETAADPKTRHFGKIHYLPPETLRREPIATGVDVYSLGVLAYHLLFGRLPFEGNSKLELFGAIQKASIPRAPCSQWVKSSNEESALHIFFNKALHKDPTLRFTNVEEFERSFFRVRFTEEPFKEPAEIIGGLPSELSRSIKEKDRKWLELIRGHAIETNQSVLKVAPKIRTESLLAQVDRRKHARFAPKDIAVTAEVLDVVDRAKLKFAVHELSKGGMRVKWEGLNPRIGTDYPIVLYLGPGYRPTKVIAKLLYETTVHSQKFASFQFDEMSEFDRKSLNHFLENRVNDELPDKKGASPIPSAPEILDVYFGDRDSFKDELHRNVKHGGMYVESPKAWNQGDRIQIRIHLPDTFQRILLKGTVVMSNRLAEKKHGVALELDLKPEEIAKLIQRTSA